MAWSTEVKVHVDKEHAFKSITGWDVGADAENRLPIEGMAAVRILEEYGKAAHLCASVESCNLAIVIDAPSVWFCPSQDGPDGVFLQQYDESIHGPGVEVEKQLDIWDFSNIKARLDGWGFFAQMVFAEDYDNEQTEAE